MDLARAGRVFRVDGVLMAILIASLGINVYLGTRSRPLDAAPQRAQLLPPGFKAPTFEGTTVTGTSVRLDFRDTRPILLYVFSPTCHWCERNLANIAAIVKSRRDVRVVGVNIGPPLDAAAMKKQPFDEIIQPASTTMRAYRLTATPSTLLITQGTITKSWSGAYTGPLAADVSKALAVTLPGLLSE